MAREHKIGGRGKNSLANKALRRATREITKKMAIENIANAGLIVNKNRLKNIQYLESRDLVLSTPIDVEEKKEVLPLTEEQLNTLTKLRASTKVNDEVKV